MIVPQDEVTIQRMIGQQVIPEDIRDEYLLRIRFLHRESSGGPMGQGMIVDMLRFLGHEPRSITSMSPVLDWREVKLGTKVDVRRAGRWTQPGGEGRYAGFVDSGTIAVEMPSGRVDEYYRHDVRIATKTMPAELSEDSFEHKEGMMDVRTDEDARANPEQPKPAEGVEQTLDTELGDSVSPATNPVAQDDGIEDEPIIETFPEVNWRDVKAGAALWVREIEDGDVSMSDAKYVKLVPGGRVMVNFDGEEKPRAVKMTDVRLAE